MNTSTENLVFDDLSEEQLNSSRYVYLLLERCVPYEIRKELNKEIPKEFWNRIGKKIHLKSRQGIYLLKTVRPNGMIVTCGTWRYTNHKDRLIPFSDFKCLAGGKHNR